MRLWRAPLSRTRASAAEKPVEPADNLLKSLDASIGSARAAQVVALLRELDQLRLDLAQPAQPHEQLLGLLDRTAQVRLAVDQQERGADLGGVGQRRALAVQLLALVDRPAQAVVAEMRADV